ncbi:Phage late control gene D protein (GPD) [Pelagimonas phthalicica]|uniref:Phage late control gene D protein (GPD) n=1 Tax=Pelagimonas phthalicica TaxID=1037362 RepID=A0A238JA82_9RHOB|nr:contractile injection system protein, VgrG/Pvc8 family [Pelagimonas phthalicica]TDS94170.1 hypothetical protein CLV87_0664 [Pelagimonas phthalicica]SMX27305.1 Phage late control gene D protein (GPD) [Pelagimonas phthalicica]
MGLSDFRPFARVTIDGVPLSSFAFSHLTSIRVTDVAGFVSDTAEIVFANASPIGPFAMPEPGAEIEIALGYLGNFKSMGLYVVDDVFEGGPPRSIRVVCRAKAQGETKSGKAPIHQQKSCSWDESLTLNDIVTTIAGENGLEPGVTEAAAKLKPGHIDQIDESDMSVLTRIAAAYDLVAKPTGGVLFVGRKGDAIKASGEPMPVLSLREADVTRWGMGRSLGEATGTVIATYRDLDQGKDIEVKVGEGEPVRRLRHRFGSQAEAQAVAQVEARRAGRSMETLSIEMPGNPSLVAESKIIPLDFSAAASGQWVVETASHELSEAGYSTTAQAKRIA